jgi:hypothetical protein
MNMFEAVDAPTPKPLPKWSEPVAGVLAAASAAYAGCRLPLPPRGLSWIALFAMATGRVLLVLLASILSWWSLSRIRREKGTFRSLGFVLQTSLDLVWLTPLALLLCEKSVWAMAVAVVLGASLAKSVWSQQDRSEREAFVEPASLFQTQSALNHSELSHPGRFWWRQLASFSAVICAEAGVLAGSVDYLVLGTLLVALSAAFFTRRFAVGTSRPDQEVSRGLDKRMVLVLSLASIVTTAVLLPYAMFPHPFGRFGLPSLTRAHAEQGDGEKGGRKAAGSTFELEDGNPGIVLWAEKHTYTTLVAPPPLLANSLLTGHRMASPLVIPFGGVYWFFRAPDTHPPDGSREEHGSPDMFGTHSTDLRSLSMEAHQNFGTLLDLDCCSKVQVAIRNTDRYPESVFLELILINTRLPGKPSQSLGRVMVRSTRPWQLYGERPIVHETLTFPIPAKASIHRFDEVAVVFHLDAYRSRDGAKIGIDRLVLVPRGL